MTDQPVQMKTIDGVGRQTERMEFLDAMRFIAAAGIIWLHAFQIGLNPISDIGRLSVPFFVISALAMIFQGIERKQQTNSAYAMSRFKRIYVPFLFWTAVYLLLRNMKHLIRPDNPPVTVQSYMLFVGAAHHLWFLPYILLVSIGMHALFRIIREKRGVYALTMILIGLVAGMFRMKQFYPRGIPTLESQIQYFLDLSWDTMPAIGLGAAVSLYFREIKNVIAKFPLLAVVLGILGAACVGINCAVERHNILEGISGLFLFVMALAPLKGKVIAWLAGLGRYSYGIYLTHVAFTLGLEVFLLRDRSKFTFSIGLTLFVLSLLGSTIATWLLHKSRYTRWTTP